ncbi:hypothetical protein FE410_05360 [Leuconostoc carnosum]|uniref:macro domain-containing protein n=1 Tax=Leuconostoc carnosum TaxID=1252 RepID=UPI00123931E2|nr:macro domain-containing protein [Leuconostoc carnosum]KAA8371119.1 hypothetical protein FE414_05355 [Leuconostoc carnosum]KAA8382760.1 hypothetical protein FE410_05360 [Leuconostoc carnosum]
MKIGCINSYLLQNVKGKIGLVFAVASGILTFFDVNQSVKNTILISAIIISLLIYISNLIFANLMSFTTFKMGDSEVSVQKGDIFSSKIYNNHDYIKVFAFNEYFDTQVDDKIISKRSLNGQFILKNGIDVNLLNEAIHSDIRLNDQHKIAEQSDRTLGNKIQYELGSIFTYKDDIFLTALTHFNKYDQAYLSMQDYVRFLINFWDEIDSLYAGRTVVITLFGSGITRLDDRSYNNTQILDTILWTFRLRRIKFKKPTKLIILLDRDTNQKINYYKIKDRFYGLQE